MATLQLSVDPLTYSPYGHDNMQRRQLTYGTAKVQPDTPGGSTSTYVQGGIRLTFSTLEPLKVTTFVPAWLELESASGAGPYIWVPGAVITNLSVAANVLTVTAANNLQPGDVVRLTGLTGAATPPAVAPTVFNNRMVRVVTATAANFTAQVGVVTMAAAAQTNAFATAVSYAPVIPGPPPGPPAGSVKLFSGTTEVAAGAVPPAILSDTIRYRAEFIRSYN